MNESKGCEIIPGPADEAQESYAAAYAPLAGLAAMAFVALLLAVCVFALYGETFAKQLSGRVGDVEAARARSLYEAGLVDNAAEAYKKALDMPFDDPNQRRWALRRFGEMLLTEKRAAEALEPLRQCLKEFPDDLTGHVLFCQALKEEGSLNELLEAAKGLGAAASANASNPIPASQAMAKFFTGYALEKLGRQGEALAAYQEGHKLDPKGPNGYHAANLLYARGDSPRALEILAGIPVDAAGEEAKSARSLRKEIESAATASPAAS